MTSNNVEQHIQNYLDSVSNHLQDLPAEERQEIVDDLRAHIIEAIGDLERASEAQVLNILERIGDPEMLAAESRPRGGDSVRVPTVTRRWSRTPSALEVAAIILTAIFWPIGVLLAWISPRWLTRDKVIATAIPMLSTAMLLVIVLGSFVVYGASSTVTNVVVDEVQPAERGPGASPEVMEPRSPAGMMDQSTGSELTRFLVVLAFLGGVIAGPFITAVFLAIRMQPVEQRILPPGAQGVNGITTATRAV